MTNRVNEARATYTAAPPRPVIEAPVRRLLRGHMQELYEGLTAIVVTNAFSSGISIKQIRLYLYRDPEENTREIVYEITVLGNPAQAFAYWDTIGLHIDKWRDGLSSDLKGKLVTQWSVRVRWD
ncbi:MAG: hypothetical protein HY671_04660 [Chloroflexi bacterium]|nr:hypothetical protein [Chloroflexota bacterium]